MILPGVYFNLPEAEYHADPAFSNSGCRKMLVSPLTFWINSPMNPDFVDKATDAMKRGKAMDKLIVEGHDAFDEAYEIAPDKADWPDAIDGQAALKAECKERGLKVGGTIAELCQRLRAEDRDLVLWPDIIADRQARAGEKEIIKPAEFDDFQAAWTCIQAHPSASKAFTGGRPQVSIFWIDAETSQRCKARLDYLKPRSIVDLKTFSNPFGLPVGKAVANAVANHRYHVQAYAYLEAVEQASVMLLDGCPCDDDEAAKALLSKGAARHFVFVFLEQGEVPNIVVRELRRSDESGNETLAYGDGRRKWREGLENFAHYMETVGPKMPWIDNEPVRPFHDEEFPLYM